MKYKKDIKASDKITESHKNAQSNRAAIPEHILTTIKTKRSTWIPSQNNTLRNVASNFSCVAPNNMSQNNRPMLLDTLNQYKEVPSYCPTILPEQQQAQMQLSCTISQNRAAYDRHQQQFDSYSQPNVNVAVPYMSQQQEGNRCAQQQMMYLPYRQNPNEIQNANIYEQLGNVCVYDSNTNDFTNALANQNVSSFALENVQDDSRIHNIPTSFPSNIIYLPAENVSEEQKVLFNNGAFDESVYTESPNFIEASLNLLNL